MNNRRCIWQPNVYAKLYVVFGFCRWFLFHCKVLSCVEALLNLNLNLNLMHWLIQVIQLTIYGKKAKLNSTSCNGCRCEHLFVRISVTLIYIYVSDITFTDPSPVSVRSAMKSYFTSWSIQNLSKRALNRLTELTSTTWLGKLFQVLTIRAQK